MVSIGAMISRLADLGKITPEYERRLWQYYSMRKWRGNEPYENKIEMEVPQNLKSAIELVVFDGVAPRARLLKEIGLNERDVSALTNLPSDFFLQPTANVVRLEPRIRESEAPSLPRQGTVLPLPDKNRN
jgi:hypothetical protein